MSKYWIKSSALLSFAAILGLLAWIIYTGLDFWLSYQAPTPPNIPHAQAPSAPSVAHLHLFEAAIVPEQLPTSTAPVALQGIAYSADPARPSQAIISQGSDSRSLHVGEAVAPGIILVAILPNAVVLRENQQYSRLPLVAPAPLRPTPPHSTARRLHP